MLEARNLLSEQQSLPQLQPQRDILDQRRKLYRHRLMQRLRPRRERKKRQRQIILMEVTNAAGFGKGVASAVRGLMPDSKDIPEMGGRALKDCSA